MKILVTGSAGHLGEALMRVLATGEHQAVGLDILPSPFTHIVASICDPVAVQRAMLGVDAVLHTATLHKPHIGTHSRQDFVDTNLSGTLNLLEQAAAAGAGAFVFSSSTSVFGDALIPPAGAPAAWITEDVQHVAKNIYGATKAAAEDLCRLFHRNQGLPCVVLRVARFFPEADDAADTRQRYDDANIKANEYLSRRVGLDDAVSAHLCAIERAPVLGFGSYIISATTPFLPQDLGPLRGAAPAVLARRVPGYEAVYRRLSWRMFPGIDRVYVNQRARDELGWRPKLDFARVVELLGAGDAVGSELVRAVGSKGYHAPRFGRGSYPFES